LAKSGSFGFAEGSDLYVEAKPNVPLVRLSDGSFVQSLVYILFCRSFLLCRSFSLAANVSPSKNSIIFAKYIKK